MIGAGNHPAVRTARRHQPFDEDMVPHCELRESVGRKRPQALSHTTCSLWVQVWERSDLVQGRDSKSRVHCTSGFDSHRSYNARPRGLLLRKACPSQKTIGAHNDGVG